MFLVMIGEMVRRIPLPEYRRRKSTELPHGNLTVTDFYYPHYHLVEKASSQTRVKAALGGIYDDADYTRDRIITSLMTLNLWERDMRRYGQSSLTPLVKTQLLVHKHLEQYVGKVDNKDRGEEKGKWFHEFRESNHEHLTDSRKLIETQSKPWYVDSYGRMINWDTIDGTALATYYVGEMERTGFIRNPHLEIPTLRSSFEWELRNLDEYDGLPSYSFVPDRKYGGLENHSWCDSWDYLPEGAGYPRAMVEVAASTWASLKHGAKMYQGFDDTFADRLATAADELKDRYNNSNKGFLMLDPKTGQKAYAMAIADGKKIPEVTINQGYALFFNIHTDNGVETVLDENTHVVFSRLLHKDMFSKGGIAVFPLGTEVRENGECYHRDPNVRWPSASIIIALGVEAVGHPIEGARIVNSTLDIPRRLGGAEEAVVYDQATDSFSAWQSNLSGQRSQRLQTWTAAGIMAGVPMIEEAASKYPELLPQIL